MAAGPLPRSSKRNWILPRADPRRKGTGMGGKRGVLCISQVIHYRSLPLLGFGQVLPDDRQ